MDEGVSCRHCKRAFTSQTVPTSILERSLQIAAQSPSSKNTQPWQVAVVRGDTKAALVRAMCAKFDDRIVEAPDYVYTMTPMPSDFSKRARDCGHALYALKGIDREDTAAREAHLRENYTFFGAPVALICHMPAQSERGTFLDMGCFIQSLMVTLVEAGLGCCPQYSICSYSDTIRQIVGLGSDRWIACGIAVGYPDETAVVNTFVPNRLPLTAFTQWLN
jgi:nitroreductase